MIISVRSDQETQAMKRAKVYRLGKNFDQIAFIRESNHSHLKGGPEIADISGHCLYMRQLSIPAIWDVIWGQTNLFLILNLDHDQPKRSTFEKNHFQLILALRESLLEYM